MSALIFRPDGTPTALSVDFRALADPVRLESTWRTWRDATRAHNAAKLRAGLPLEVSGLDLPTFKPMMRAYRDWETSAAVTRRMRGEVTS